MFNQTLLILLALSNVTGDFRCAYNTILVILYRGNGKGDVEERAILASAHRFEVVYALTLPESGENVRLFFLPIIGDLSSAATVWPMASSAV